MREVFRLGAVTWMGLVIEEVGALRMRVYNEHGSFLRPDKQSKIDLCYVIFAEFLRKTNQS